MTIPQIRNYTVNYVIKEVIVCIYFKFTVIIITIVNINLQKNIIKVKKYRILIIIKIIK